MVALGFKEWKDGFNTDNIPSTIADKSFHLDTRAGVGIKLNQNDQEVNFDVNVKLFRKGFRDPASAIDQVLSDCQSIIVESCKASNRLTGNLKNVVFSGATIDPIADSNDNFVVLTMTFTAFVIIAV